VKPCWYFFMVLFPLRRWFGRDTCPSGPCPSAERGRCAAAPRARVYAKPMPKVRSRSQIRHPDTPVAGTGKTFTGRPWWISAWGFPAT